MAIQIDNSTLTQLFVTEDKKEIVTPMSKGTLAVVEVAESHSLRLIVGSSAFELKKDCPLKNYNDQPLSYIFSPPLAGTETLAHGTGIYIKLDLPASAGVEGSAEAQQKNAFEELLLKYNLLIRGPAALADEFARKLAMGAAVLANTISDKVQQHVDSTPSRDVGSMPPAAHTALDGAVNVTDSAVKFTGTAADSITQAVASAGRRLSAALVEFKTDLQNEYPQLKTDPNAPKSEFQKTATSTWTSITAAASTLGDGLKEVYEATTSGVKEIVQNDIGPEAAKLSSKLGQTSSNIGDAAANVFKTTSAVVQGKTFADGVRTGQTPSHSPTASTSASPVASTSAQPMASTSAVPAASTSAAPVSTASSQVASTNASGAGFTGP